MTKIHTIDEGCLPDPFTFNKYYFNIIEDDEVERSRSICIGRVPTLDNEALVRYLDLFEKSSYGLVSSLCWAVVLLYWKQVEVKH